MNNQVAPQGIESDLLLCKPLSSLLGEGGRGGRGMSSSNLLWEMTAPTEV